MLIRKIKKGIYEILLEDNNENQYRVEDQRQEGALGSHNSDGTVAEAGVEGSHYPAHNPWAIWEKVGESKKDEENFWGLGPEIDVEDYVLLINQKTFKDCVFTIALGEEANECIN